KPSKFTGDVFCHPTTENARIPGYVSIFRRKQGEKQTRKWVVYFQTAPKFNASLQGTAVVSMHIYGKGTSQKSGFAILALRAGGYGFRLLF
ncbi:MAG: hypothetical protein LBB90_10945, partial [Tannerella sp.]|nr:hypothetical protein [Tannerella sp.]